MNDASHDDAYEAVLAPYYPAINYIRLPHRSGPAHARNVGVRRASGDTIVFTDDDCVPPPQWLSGIDATMTQHSLEAIGGPALPFGGTSVVKGYLAAIGFLQRPILVEGALVCLPTANFAVTRAAFDSVDGFDERFRRPGGEDTDLLYRLKLAGCRVAFVPSMITFHEACCGLRSLLGRYYNYGFGVAQHLTYRALTLDYGLLRARSRLRLVPHLPELILWALKTARHREFSRLIPPSTRLAFRVLAVWVELAYQIGGIDGLRFADLPQVERARECPSDSKVPLRKEC